MQPQTAGLTAFLAVLAIFCSTLPSGFGQVPLPANSQSRSRSFAGVPLPPPSHSGGSAGVPLSATGPGGSRTGVTFSTGGSRLGVPLPAPTSNSGGRFTSTAGRGILETGPQSNLGIGFRSNSPNSFHINELPSSFELDKKLSPVPPYFVFYDEDDDAPKKTISIGGPKTGGLLPISNPTSDPKLLRLLSQPVVRQRLVAEAGADKALKISAILMAHRQVRIIFYIYK